MFCFTTSRNLTPCGQFAHKQRKLSQKLSSAFSSMNRINKRVDSTTRRRFNICFHSKISKPKCSKTQRALARPSAQLQYGFSMWTCTFIYKVWTQTKRWKRPWLLDKFILCCFTLHSATNTPGIHKCYWILEGVNKTQRVEQHSRRIWSLQSPQTPPAAASMWMKDEIQSDPRWGTTGTLIGQWGGIISKVVRNQIRETLRDRWDVEVLQVRPSSSWWRLNQSLWFVRTSRFHELETVKSVSFISNQLFIDSSQSSD